MRPPGFHKDKGDKEQPASRLKPNTLNNYWRAVRLFYNWSHQTGRMKRNPTAGIKGPGAAKTLIATFQPDHIEAMLTLCLPNTWWGIRDRAILITFLLTGVRLGELVNLTVSSLNMKDGNDYMVVAGKGSRRSGTRVRRVYLDPRVRLALLDWLEVRPASDSDALWLSLQGKPLGKAAVQKMMHRLGDRAGVSGIRVSPHTGRHTFAIETLREGKDVCYLQQLLGQDSLKSTEIYVRTLNAEDALRWHREVRPFKGWKLDGRPKDR
ncbi:MAG: tyrosine-type recombinase/integrase [Chloroflexi bacterium]|nr:tyrosine-type recombinase/integrase [Chloroflexota bacterium]